MIDHVATPCVHGYGSNRNGAHNMKNPTLTKIRQHVESTGGRYSRQNITLAGNPAYQVNGVTMTKAEMIERFQRGML